MSEVHIFRIPNSNFRLPSRIGLRGDHIAGCQLRPKLAVTEAALETVTSNQGPDASDLEP